MGSWFGAVPSWLVLVVFTVVPALVAAAIHTQVRRFVRMDRLIAHHDVAGFLVAVVGVLYAVVLGFIVVNVWTAYDAAQRNADAEAGDVGELFAVAQNFHEPTRDRVRVLLAEYAFDVRDREWPMLAYAHQDMHARNLMVETFRVIAQSRIEDRTFGAALAESTLRTAAFNDLHDLSVNRRQRLLDAETHLPGTLYLALFIGAAIVLAFVFLFGVEDLTLQLTMTGLVMGTIGLLIGVIVEFDRPYGGGITVSPAAWTLVIENNRLGSYVCPPPGEPASGEPAERRAAGMNADVHCKR